MEFKSCLLLVLCVSFTLVGIAMADAQPGHCNTVKMGSSFTGSKVSMVTSASEDNIASNHFQKPSMDYTIELSGIGTASGYIQAHIMEGKTAGWINKYSLSGNGDNGQLMLEQYPVFHQSVDLYYSEITTVSGNILQFRKSMSYNSGQISF